ncbi:HEPN domain-containing protein [Microbacterium sp. NPDC087665]|uniref:HEPN domain-containing protein n=1 Tax=Microbacterium sp. NPDC087665 TaxID=3364194 RepID=UPI00382BF8D8
MIDDLLDKRQLEQVSANVEHAEVLLERAGRHIVSAATLRQSDPDQAFTSAYDAARKALTACLAVQGLRPTSRGGHLAVYEAAMAQFEPPMGAKIRQFGWMRKMRNESEYPDFETPEVVVADVDAAIAAADEIIRIASVLKDTLPPYRK